MFLCWSAKSDKDFPYGWSYQSHGGQIRPVYPVVIVAGPAPGDSEPRASSELRDEGRESTMPRPERRRRDHATELPRVSRAARTASGSAADSPVRASKYHFQYKRTNIYSSSLESGSSIRRASPEFSDEGSVSSTSSSLEDVFLSPQEYSRQEHPAAEHRHEDLETGRPAAGYRPSTSHSPQVRYIVRPSQSAPFEATAPRPERRTEHVVPLPIRSRRARYPAASGRGRRDSRPSRQEDILQPGEHDSGHAAGDARPAPARKVYHQQHVQPERSESRPPRAGRYPQSRLVDDRQGGSLCRDKREKPLRSQASGVGLCGCDICQFDAYF